MVRLLWASPLPPIRSGVSDYTVELLPRLTARGARVRLLAPPGWRPEPGWEPPGGVNLVPAETPPAADELQVVHLGNNPYHEWLLPLLGRGRALVVLHDLVLHHLLVESTVARGDLEAFRSRLEAAEPGAGEVLAEARRWGFWSPRDPFLFPARRAFLEGAAGVVVHSRWAQEQVSAEMPGLPVFRVPLGVEEPGTVERDAVRLELGVVEDELLVMHLGFLTPAKGLEQVVQAVAAVRRAGASVKLLLVGEGDAGGEVQAVADAAGVGDSVLWTGWVEAGRFRQLPAAADLGVVVRRPSAGESSAAALRFLACGTPVAVSALPQFLELPAAVAPRLTPGCEAAEMARLLLAAWRDRSVLRSRREAARRYFLAHHTLERTAAGLFQAFERLAGTA